MSNELKQLLNYDPLNEAEKATGRSYKSDEFTSNLGMLNMIQNANKKEAILRLSRDSVFCNHLTDYLEIICEEGFEKVLELPFAGRSWNGETPPPETFYIFWHSCGILLAFDTFGTDKVNSGNFYYCIEKTAQNTEFYSAMESYGSTSDGYYEGHHDCREAIRFHIAELRKVGNFLNPWPKQPHLWLLHHMDTVGQGSGYKGIIAERISMLPAHVQEAIKGQAAS